jgi:hypothetical protein
MEEMRNVYTVWLQHLRERDHLEDLGVNQRIILKWSLRIYEWDSVYWTDLAHDKDGWQALVNMVMNLQVP